MNLIWRCKDCGRKLDGVGMVTNPGMCPATSLRHRPEHDSSYVRAIATAFFNWLG